MNVTTYRILHVTKDTALILWHNIQPEQATKTKTKRERMTLHTAKRTQTVQHCANQQHEAYSKKEKPAHLLNHCKSSIHSYGSTSH